MPLNKQHILGLTLIVLINNGWTLPGDNQQPINIQSDQATQKVIDDKEHITYSGNVIMTQGSLLIKASHITLLSKNKQVEELIATGEPAHFQQQSDPNQQPVKARANTIEYRLPDDIATFIGNAHIEQDGTIVSGEQIDYYIGKEQVKATGNGNATSRVQMIFEPGRSQKPAKESNGNTDSN